MSREALPSGKVRVRVTVRGKRRTLGVFSDDTAAQRMERAHLANLDDHTVERPDGKTLRDFGRDWLEDRELRGNRLGRRVKDLGSERSLWGTHIETAHFADFAVESIRPCDVEEWVRELANRDAMRLVRTGASTVAKSTGRKLSTSTIKHALRVLKSMLDTAVSREIVARNVADKISAPTQRREVEPWTFLSVEEIGKLDQLPEPHRTRFLFAVYTGVRQMELWHLRRSDIDLAGGWFTVREGADGSTKSGKIRKAPLLPQCRALVEAWLARTPRAAASSLLFPGPDGEPFKRGHDGGWEDKQERRPLSKLDKHRADERAGKLSVVQVDKRQGSVLVSIPGWRTKAGIRRSVRFHDLRHTCASALIAGSWGRVWSLVEVQKFLGHESASTTERYAHLSPGGLLRAARETVDQVPSPKGSETLPTDCPRQLQPHEIIDRTEELRSRRSQVRLLHRAPPVNSSTYAPSPVGRDTLNVGSRGQGVEAAKRVLSDVIAGAVSLDALSDLALATLANAATAPAEHVRLALEVREGGPHAVRRAIELAACVLSEGQAATETASAQTK